MLSLSSSRVSVRVFSLLVSDIFMNSPALSMLVIGIVALVIVVASVIFALVSLKKAKTAEAALDKEVLASNAQQSNSNGSAQSSGQNGDVFDMNEFKKDATKKCEYCGSTYSAKLDKCPNCGASNR